LPVYLVTLAFFIPIGCTIEEAEWYRWGEGKCPTCTSEEAEAGWRNKGQQYTTGRLLVGR